MWSSAPYSSDPAKGWRPWGALVPFLGIAFVVATAIGPETLLQNAQLLDAKENPIGLTGFAAFLLLPFGALGLAVLAWTRFVERRPLAAIGLAGGAAWRKLISGLLIGAAMMIAIVAADWLAGGFAAAGYGPAFASPAALGGIALLLVCFVVQSGVEELVFRGWMLSAIAAKFGVIAAVAISSLVFALLHFGRDVTWLSFANVYLFAVFACSWSLRTGNIWGAMGWHAGWNGLLAVGFEIKVTGLDAHLPALLVKLTPVGPAYLTGGALGAEGSIACSAVLIAGIAFNLLRRRVAPP
jgi:hypothetical protein